MTIKRSTVDAPVRRRASRPGSLELDKEADVMLTVRASDELALLTNEDPEEAIRLEGTPTVRIDKLTRGSEPEDWVDVTSDFVIDPDDINIVDSIADDGSTNLGADQAVEFLVQADTGDVPDETDDPTPGDEYRVVVVAAIDNFLHQWVGKVPLIIHY